MSPARDRRRGDRGLSLIELLVGVAIGGIVVAALATFFNQMLDVSKRMTKVIDQTSDVFILESLLRRDVSRAWTIVATSGLLTITFTDGTASTYRTLCAARTSAHAALPSADLSEVTTRLNSEMLDDGDPSTTDVACSPNELVVVMRSVTGKPTVTYPALTGTAARIRNGAAGIALRAETYANGVVVAFGWGTVVKGSPVRLGLFRTFYAPMDEFVGNSIELR
jgi:prepilin-type N-terminal cleavage/methylation domain-containing protein